MIRTGKKFLAFMLAFTMIFSLAACGKKEKTTNATPTTGVTKAAEATTAATPTTVPDKFEAFDFGGKTIKVGIWWDYYYTSEHTKPEDDPAVANVETAQMKIDNIRRIEEKYNCKIQFVNLSWAGIMSSINTTIAAGKPECDIYLTDLQFGIPAALNGLCQDLTKIAPENSDLFTDQKVIKPLEAFFGTYFFTEQTIPLTGMVIGYNATMIKDLGLEDPQQLYKDGKWTWDKFAELAQKGTKDSDGDGTTDTYGYGGLWTTLVNGLVANNNGAIAGSKTEGLSSKPVMESFEFIDRMYNKDKFARPWNKDNWDDNLNAWSDGKVMFWTAQAWSLKSEADAAVKAGAELPFEYHVVPFPNGPSGDGKAYSPIAGNYYMIPVGVEEPGKVLQIFEEFLNWHGGDTELRDDPQWFESCFMSEEDVAIALECGNNTKLDPWGSLAPYFDLGSTIFFPLVVDKNKTVSQAVETAKPMLQNALDVLYTYQE